MCDEKLSSNAVPLKFVDWLLAMGCPAQKVPAVDKIAEMCRGQYYMVWRSLMEHVEAKEVIRRKRLQVFIDDMRRCDRRNVLDELNTDVVVPEQLLLWKRQSELKEKVADMRNHVSLVRQDCDQLMEKITRKGTQYNLDRSRLEDTQRRAWFLDHLAQELQNRKANLEETKSIAHSLCSVSEDGDLQDKLDKCVTSLRRQSALPTPAAASVSVLSNPAASSSVLSSHGDSEFEDQMYSLVRCRGDALCSQLRERRAALVATLGQADTTTAQANPGTRQLTPHRVLTHSAALLSTLVLEAVKNRTHLKQAHKRLVAAVAEPNNYLPDEYCELLVMRCEKAHLEAKVKALRTLLGELTAGSGVFRSGDESEARGGAIKPISSVDAAIESKRDELRRVIGLLATTERKIQSVRECLLAVFNKFNKELSRNGNDRYRGLQLDMPQETIASLVQYYEERREARGNKVDISMDFELSDCSYTEGREMNNPRFIDELNIYLKKFNLEKNRKIVLESGQKLWVFETLQASLSRLHSAWLSANMSCALLGSSLSDGLGRVARAALARAALGAMARSSGDDARRADVIEIKPQAEEERQTTDRIKKRIRDDLAALQKISRTLDVGQRNLQLWSDNLMRRHVAARRTVDGMTYRDYEAYYVETCMP